MWRALFFLGGLFLLSQGAVALAIDAVTLHSWATKRLSEAGVSVPSRLVLPIWLAPTLVSTGGVTLIYAIALPRKSEPRKGKAD